MNRHRADRLVALVVAATLLVGGLVTWQASQQTRAHSRMMASMMDGTTVGTPGVDPLWYALGTLLAAVAIGGAYAAVRDDLFHSSSRSHSPESAATETGRAEAEPAPTDATEPVGQSPQTDDRRVLDLLPEDERRVLEPVVDSPGITQIALRDRSEFSKSKVSQTVSDLEKRGLLYRERQGRTYRVYPGEDLREESS